MKKRVAAWLIAGVLMAGTILPVMASEPKETEQVDKAETVYVDAGADGSVTSIKVREQLKNTSDGETVEDYTNLTDIKNKEGDEEFTLDPEGNLIWENHGEDIAYEGKSDKKIPVNVKVTYYLNGKEVSAEEIAGESGEVKIRLDYENVSSESVTVDGKEIETKVPFLAISAVTLPGDIFSNVKVTNGEIMSSGSDTIVAGAVFPGLSESLGLEDYEATEEIDLPEYIEVTADAEEFELEFTATIVSPMSMDDLEDSDFDDLDELSDSMAELTDASGQLADGAAELASGISEFQQYMSSYAEGTGAVAEALDILTEGLGVFASESTALVEGAAAIEESLAALDTAVSTVAQSVPDTDGLDKSLEELQGDVDVLKTLTGTESDLQKAVETLGLAELADKVNKEANAQANEQLADAVEAAVTEALETEFENNTEFTEGQKQTIIAAAVAESKESGFEKKIDINLSDTLSSAQSDLSDAVESLNSVAEDIQEKVEEIGADAGNITGVGDIKAALGELQTNITLMQGYSEKLTEGVAEANTVLSVFYIGYNATSQGADALALSGVKLNTGFQAIADGSGALAEGLGTFDREGIQKLGDLAGDDLKTMESRIKALREAEKQYQNYGGLKEGHTGSTSFMIETKKIEK